MIWLKKHIINYGGRARYCKAPRRNKTLFFRTSARVVGKQYVPFTDTSICAASIARLVAHGRFPTPGRCPPGTWKTWGCCLLTRSLHHGVVAVRVHVLQEQAHGARGKADHIGGCNQRILQHPATDAPNQGAHQVGQNQQGRNGAAVVCPDHSRQRHQDADGPDETAKGGDETCHEQGTFYR